MPAASISFRESIRWLPDAASEPTQTIVLTGLESGVFLDVRFQKESGELDWAFAGYRSQAGPNSTKFTHHIDSRTPDALDVVDLGTNTPLPDGTTLEVGEMLNPATGRLTAYEEVWRDEECAAVLIIRNGIPAAPVWRARVGDWQLGLGRPSGGQFWAWQAMRNGPGEAWTRVYSAGLGAHNHEVNLDYLPEECGPEWEVGSTVQWLGEPWEVLVHGDQRAIGHGP
ncbi:hypothetical protein B0H17DRAFT_1085753 [Mycena rosella]|uniref:Protein HRI1 n=1 Tax=Mycena rosella TaxID=1033263 RepID=A0AAD7CYU5_MYCRO|nr:hypothetical protein B0H17DRAFT_1085753 [Mycena rosella]